MPALPAGRAEARPFRRVRAALIVQFVLFGFLMSSWMSRMPSVREGLDVSALQLGALLIAGGVGSLVGALIVGGLTTRFGSRAILVVGFAGNVVGFALLAISTTTAIAPLFLVGMLVNGLSGALVNVPINVNAAALEQSMARTMLPLFHAAYSIGAACGAFAASLLSAAGVPVSWQIVAVTVVVTVVRLACWHAATQPSAAGRREHTERRAGRAFRSALGAWVEPRTLLLGLVLLAGSLSEGTATTWLSLAVVDGFDQPESVGAAVYATFLCAMTVFRIFGSALIDRFGRVIVLRASGVSAFTGVLLLIFGPLAPIGWIGVVLWGFGAALGAPIAIAAASDDPARAGERVSVVTSFSTIATLAAPPVLGLLVDQVGALDALLIVAGAVVLSVSVAGATRRRPGGDGDTLQTSPIRLPD
ncbi:MAG: MFS transporter [Actinomycetota bacterium]